MFEQNSEDSFAHCERRRIMAYLANLKTSTPPFVLPHHLQNQILIQMLFFKPSDGLLEADISSDRDCNQISVGREAGDLWVCIFNIDIEF